MTKHTKVQTTTTTATNNKLERAANNFKHKTITKNYKPFFYYKNSRMQNATNQTTKHYKHIQKKQQKTQTTNTNTNIITKQTTNNYKQLRNNFETLRTNTEQIQHITTNNLHK